MLKSQIHEAGADTKGKRFLQVLQNLGKWQIPIHLHPPAQAHHSSREGRGGLFSQYNIFLAFPVLPLLPSWPMDRDSPGPRTDCFTITLPLLTSSSGTGSLCSGNLFISGIGSLPGEETLPLSRQSGSVYRT